MVTKAYTPTLEIYRRLHIKHTHEHTHKYIYVCIKRERERERERESKHALPVHACIK